MKLFLKHNTAKCRYDMSKWSLFEVCKIHNCDTMQTSL